MARIISSWARGYPTTRLFALLCSSGEAGQFRVEERRKEAEYAVGRDSGK
jgi:hypothetical protein